MRAPRVAKPLVVLKPRAVRGRASLKLSAASLERGIPQDGHVLTQLSDAIIKLTAAKTASRQLVTLKPRRPSAPATRA